MSFETAIVGFVILVLVALLLWAHRIQVRKEVAKGTDEIKGLLEAAKSDAEKDLLKVGSAIRLEVDKIYADARNQSLQVLVTAKTEASKILNQSRLDVEKLVQEAELKARNLFSRV